jgi:hypothetical protein
LLLLAIAVFFVISALLARAFSAESAERSAITAVVVAEARGDRSAVMSHIVGCARDKACRSGVAAYVARLRHAGSVSIIQIQTSAGFSLTGTTGTARVVWTAGGSLPIVQCLRVRRAGNVISGLRVRLLALSPRIASDAVCPARF